MRFESKEMEQESKSPATKGSANQNHDQWVGDKLRSARKAEKLTLKVVAEAAGLSIGQLSQIERGLSSPSMRILRLICHCLGIDGATLFQPVTPTGEESSSKFTVTSHNRRQLKFKDIRVTKFRITPQVCGEMEMYLIVIQKGGSSGEGFQAAPSERVGYVIEGELDLYMADQVMQLKAGDSFGCNTGIPYRWNNSSDKTATILWVANTHYYV